MQNKINQVFKLATIMTAFSLLGGCLASVDSTELEGSEAAALDPGQSDPGPSDEVAGSAAPLLSDSGFGGGDGRVEIYVPQSEGVTALVQAPLGNIYGIGTAMSTGASGYPVGHIAVRQLDGNGTYRNRWDIRIPGVNDHLVGAATRLPGWSDNVIVVGSASTTPGSSHIFLMQLQSTGLDTSGAFGGSDGVALFNATSEPLDMATSVEYWNDRIVVGGNACLQDYNGKVRCRAFVARFRPDGSRDTAFGTSGVYVYPWAGTFATEDVRGIAVQNDGRVVIVSELKPSSAHPVHTIVRRVDSYGRPEAHFAGSGYVDITGHSPNAVEIDPSTQEIVLATTSSGVMHVWRHTQGGYQLLDFGNGDGTRDARSTVQFWSTRTEQASDLRIDSTGRIYLLGSAAAGDGSFSASRFAVARLDKNGTLDSSFGSYGNGKDYYQFSSSTTSYGLSLQLSGNKVLAAGLGLDSSNNSRFVFARFQ